METLVVRLQRSPVTRRCVPASRRTLRAYLGVCFLLGTFAIAGLVQYTIWGYLEGGVVVRLPLHLSGDSNKAMACRAVTQLADSNIAAVHPQRANVTVDVVVCLDEHYMPGLLAMIESTLKHTRNSVSFHIVAAPPIREGLEEFLFALYKQKAGQKISFEVTGFNPSHVKKLIKVWPGNDTIPEIHGNALNYARFYLPYLFPHLKKAVFLDADLIVLGNIVELATVLDHQKEFLLAAAHGIPHTYGTVMNFESELIQKTFDPTELDLNAGVAVINFEAWRERNVTAEVEHWLRQHQQSKLWSWGSQPLLLATFYRRYLPLDSSWNLCHFGVDYLIPNTVDMYRAKILHWNGRNKPWRETCVTEATCFSDCWSPYLDKDRVIRVLDQSPRLAQIFLPYLQDVLYRRASWF